MGLLAISIEVGLDRKVDNNFFVVVFESGSGLMARLTISALDQISKDSSSWKEPLVHKAILVSGLSVLTVCLKCLERDLLKN